MPLYEYQCEQCGATFEVIQKFSDSPIDACRSCGGPAHRLLSAPAIHLKGTGWYITDYAKKGAGSADADKPAPAGESSPGTAAAAPESKPESKSSPNGASTPASPSTTSRSDAK